VREQLDEATFDASWAEGRAMSLVQAVSHALKVGQPKPASPSLQGISGAQANALPIAVSDLRGLADLGGLEVSL